MRSFVSMVPYKMFLPLILLLGLYSGPCAEPCMVTGEKYLLEKRECPILDRD